MAEFNRLYWRRCGHVEIQGSDGSMHSFGGENGGLDFKFKIKKDSVVYTEFSVGILGLPSEIVNEITVWRPDEAYANPRRVRVFAGYDGNESLIAEGYVFTAIPTNPPEMWVNIECKRFINVHNLIENEIEVIDTPLEEVLSMIGQEVGIEKTRWESASVDGSTKINWVLNGNRDDLIYRFAKVAGVIIYDDDGVLVATDVLSSVTQSNEQIGANSTLNVDTGLLSVGNLTFMGANATMRLNDSAHLYSWIKLESMLIPKASDKYLVIAKEHTGHLRGEEWFTKMELFRVGH